MHLDPWILTCSAVTVFLTLWMGFRSAGRSKTASDFFVAGRSVSVGWNASAISGEYLSAASFMGIAGMVMSVGYDALWYPVCYACGYLFLLLFIAGPLRRFGAYTIPDFAEGRYDSPLFRKIAVVFVLFIGFFYTMPQMKGAGTTLAYIFQDLDLRHTAFEFLAPKSPDGLPQKGFPYWAGVVLIGAVITLNVAVGGMKGITLVQAFQYWLKMFAISVPIFVLMAVHGSYGRHLDAQSSAPATAPLPAPPATAPTAWLESSGPETPIPVSASLALPSHNGWVDIPAPAPLARSMDRLQSFFGDANHFSLGTPKVVGVLIGYCRLAGEPVRAHTNLGLTRLLGPLEINRNTWQATRATLESYLRSNQVALVRTPDGTLRAMTLTQEAACRQLPGPSAQRRPLPEQAPPDRAWLNPFGPLTAKAAKAAQLTPEQAKPYSLLYTYSLIIALVCGTAGLPHILVRFYTNPDGAAAKRTTMWVMVLIGVFYVFPPVFGVMGRNLLPELYAGVGAKGTDKIVLELPRVLGERFGPLGSILSGITCAGAFAAFMSTFSGLLVSMTGALAHDVYGRILRPHSTPAQRMRMFRVSAVLLGSGAILGGTQVELLQINFMVGQAFAIAAASYFPLLFMSCWWRGMTMTGAATGMLVGGCSAVVAISLTSFSDLGWIPLAPFWAKHPLLRILSEQPALWAVPLAISLMIAISKLTARTVPADIRLKMLVLHAPEQLGLKQEYIQEHASH